MLREENNSKRDGGSLLRSESSFVLQWGCRKRLRCIKDRGTNNQPPGSGPVRKRSAYPSPQVLRNSEMREHSNGVRGLDDSPNRKGTSYNNNNNNNNTDNNHSSGGSGSSECGGDTKGAAWSRKFVIGLTNKEKEEDYMAIKGSKLPQRPKKRAKFIQHTLNLVSPGAWLCDLSLERYEVREKKISKRQEQEQEG